MPIAPDIAATIPAWKARKDAQWARIAGTMAGLQLVRTGELRTQYMLVCSLPEEDGRPAFYEGVLIGQLPRPAYEFKRGQAGKPIKALIPEDRKPLNKRSIDLEDEEIDQVLAQWKSGKSALELPFVLAVYTRDRTVMIQES